MINYKTRKLACPLQFYLFEFIFVCFSFVSKGRWCGCCAKHLFNSIILLCFSLMYWSRRTLWRMLSMRSVCQVMPLSCQCSSAFLSFATLPWYRSIHRHLKTEERGLKVNEHKMRAVVDVVIGVLLLPSIYCSILQNQDLKTTASQKASNNTGIGVCSLPNHLLLAVSGFI